MNETSFVPYMHEVKLIFYQKTKLSMFFIGLESHYVCIFIIPKCMNIVVVVTTACVARFEFPRIRWLTQKSLRCRYTHVCLLVCIAIHNTAKEAKMFRFGNRIFGFCVWIWTYMEIIVQFYGILSISSCVCFCSCLCRISIVRRHE